MIAVIQCAARKRDDAGYLTTQDGKRVVFVAQPGLAPQLDGVVYARPDDSSGSGRTWREELIAYNQRPAVNPQRLLPAFELYANDAFRRLADRFGIENTYILSAGWGLIAASFLTPYYDITFSAAANSFKRRRKSDSYRDLCMLPGHVDEPVVFFGGKDYLPLFCELTRSVRSSRIVFYNSAQAPVAPGCSIVRFQTATRTNWHYECVDAVLAGQVSELKPPSSRAPTLGHGLS